MTAATPTNPSAGILEESWFAKEREGERSHGVGALLRRLGDVAKHRWVEVTQSGSRRSNRKKNKKPKMRKLPRADVGVAWPLADRAATSV